MNPKNRSDSPTVRAACLAGIRLGRPDVARSIAFFEDLGLEGAHGAKESAQLGGRLDAAPSVLIEQGDAAYLGLDLHLDTDAELATLAAATGVDIAIDPTRGVPTVALSDPEGMSVRVSVRPAVPADADADDAQRANGPGRVARVNKQRAAVAGPAAVYRLGHTVHAVRNLRRAIAWYQDTFGMIVSDFQMLPDDPIPAVAFLRFDRGDTPTDHHSLALISAMGQGHLHTAFEVLDMEAVARGRHWLTAQRRRHSWGLGRHVLGSQVFDYWRDPSGAQFELYADGDAYDTSKPTGYHDFAGSAQHQWGPDMSADMRGSVLRLAKDIVAGLASDHDLTASRLIKLARAAKR